MIAAHVSRKVKGSAWTHPEAPAPDGCGTAFVLLDADTVIRVAVEFPQALKFERLARWGRDGREGRMFLALIRTTLLYPGMHGVVELVIEGDTLRLKPERDT